MISRFGCALSALACFLAGAAQGQQLATERIPVNFTHPVQLGQAPGDTSRLFVLERRRGLRIVKNGVANPDYFLNIASELTLNEAATGFAFHPDYENNGRFFLVYMDKDERSHVAEYKVSDDPDFADPQFRVQILGPVQQPALIHNWNCIKFGPDGMLYVATGDGVWVADGGVNNSQNLSNPFGKILRLDVDAPFPHIPADNPLVGIPNVDEHIWAWGVRNPWRISFDSLTGDLYIGDVGFVDWEEINVLNAGQGAGANLGWRCYDGEVCVSNFGLGNCFACDDPSYLPPALVYPHSATECAVIGGEVYRGSAIPELGGAYFYADYCANRIWSFRWDGSRATDHQEHTFELQVFSDGPVDSIVGFSSDLDGEIYFITNTGFINKIVPAECETANYCHSTLNSAGTNATISSEGTTEIANDDFTLTVQGSLPNRAGLFFYGPSPMQTPFGDGLLCTGPNISRLQPITLSDMNGYNEHALDYSQPPSALSQIEAGSTWHFQYWYRDSQTAGTFNLSDGLAAHFCP